MEAANNADGNVIIASPSPQNVTRSNRSTTLADRHGEYDSYLYSTDESENNQEHTPEEGYILGMKKINEMRFLKS